MEKEFNKNTYKTLFVGGICIVLAILFRNLYSYGMCYDEVYRFNNWFPIFNKDAYPYDQSICSVQIGNINIPLMLKQYISFISIIPYLPAAWFDNSFLVLRSLYYVYTLAGVLITYFFLSKYNDRLAVIAATLLTINPLIYPYIKFGWSNYIYAIGLILTIVFWNKYQQTNKLRYLWLSVFVLCLQINIQFYFIWVAASLIITLFIVYPKKSIDAVFHVKNFFIVISAALLGLIHYVVYNIKNGFPTLVTLWNYLFNLDEYNQNAIDNKQTTSLVDGFQVKVNTYLSCVGIWKPLFLGILLFIVIANIVLVSVFIYRKQIQEKKGYFVAGLVTIFSFLMMLISPNSQGAHHLTYIVIPLFLWIACTLELLIECANKRGVKYWIYGVVGAITIIFFIQSNATAPEDEISKSDYFSSNIFDLIEYVDEQEEITDKNIIFLQWGFASQFYFMHNGEFQISELFWEVADLQGIQYKTAQYLQNMEGDVLYVPAYYTEVSNFGDDVVIIEENGVDKYIKVDELLALWMHEFEANGGICTIENTFNSREGNGQIVLFKVENVENLKQNLQ